MLIIAWSGSSHVVRLAQALRTLVGAQQGKLDSAAKAPAALQKVADAEMRALAYRANKKALLWDCLLAHEIL